MGVRWAMRGGCIFFGGPMLHIENLLLMAHVRVDSCECHGRRLLHLCTAASQQLRERLHPTRGHDRCLVLRLAVCDRVQCTSCRRLRLGGAAGEYSHERHDNATAEERVGVLEVALARKAAEHDRSRLLLLGVTIHRLLDEPAQYILARAAQTRE